MIDSSVLKDAIDFAFSEMPKESMSPEEALRQKRIMLDRVEKGDLKSPGDIVAAFDELNKGG